MRFLCADIGNSHVKTAVYDDGVMRRGASFLRTDAPDITAWVRREAAHADGALLSAVASIPDGIEEALREVAVRYERLTCHTPLPITNAYRTPQTLGTDRLAAAAGASSLYPGRNLLVIDAGTAITFDTLTAGGVYLGGTISPGLRMRFEALHQHAAQLPLEAPLDGDGLVGTTTREAVAFGVQNGLVAEALFYVNRMQEQKGDSAVVLTGGDMIFLMNRLKKWTNCPIFAVENLVLDGLHAIVRSLISASTCT